MKQSHKERWADFSDKSLGWYANVAEATIREKQRQVREEQSNLSSMRKELRRRKREAKGNE